MTNPFVLFLFKYVYLSFNNILEVNPNNIDNNKQVLPAAINYFSLKTNIKKLDEIKKYAVKHDKEIVGRHEQFDMIIESFDHFRETISEFISKITIEEPVERKNIVKFEANPAEQNRQAVIKAAKATGKILTVEDHNVLGGLGARVADVLMEEGVAAKVKKIGVPDCFAEFGYPEELYPYYGLDIDGIVKTALEFLK